MQTILFEERQIRFTDSLERMLIRVVRDTPEYQLGWARRTSLVREFRTRLVENARRAARMDRIERSRVLQHRESCKVKMSNVRLSCLGNPWKRLLPTRRPKRRTESSEAE